MTLLGLTSLSDVAPVAAAYGLMLMGTGLFLLAGLKVRERLLDRAESHPCASRGRRPPLAATARDRRFWRAGLRSSRRPRDGEHELR